ncbi:flagellar biosynthetic protein FliO [Anaerobacillus sp. HL2]|nr:flagellar biosynthetic protein FliO [Anaerobacillus sp. HL2]
MENVHSLIKQPNVAKYRWSSCRDNRSIQIIRVGKRILIVVGVGESIQLLKEIDDENEVDKILEDYDIQEVQQSIFLPAFQWVQSKINRQERENTDSKVQFKSLLENQLTGVKNAQKQAHTAIKEKEQQNDVT